MHYAFIHTCFLRLGTPVLSLDPAWPGIASILEPTCLQAVTHLGGTESERAQYTSEDRMILTVQGELFLG